MAANGGGGNPSRVGKAPLPHIDDLTTAPVDVDLKLPLRKVLEIGDSCMRQAETYRDFGRPDIALREYLKASIIAVGFVPRHREFVSLQAERPDLGRLHGALLRKIKAQHDAFEKIKADIIADNARTGVQPSSHRSGDANAEAKWQPTVGSLDRTAAIQFPSAPTTDPSVLNGAARVGGSPNSKSKPAPAPKPPGLHGNVIKPTVGATNTAAQDLNARFANLRRPGAVPTESRPTGPTAAPVQDSRIKTHPHPVAPTRPIGPRQPAVQPQRPSVSVENILPDLPKVPDAIYSPARGTVSNEAAKLPSSTTRGLFSRTGSSTSLSTATLTPHVSSDTGDYFAAQRFSGASGRPATPKVVNIPEGDTITAEDLYKIMREAHVLLIDVRSRESFDEGHIMSQSIVCIEPIILLRDNLSASDIGDSLGLSPDQEQLHFERRDRFDLVVYYDQETETLPLRAAGGSEKEIALVSLRRALVEFNFQRELRNPPKLLVGGISAWTDLMGPHSLQAASTTGITARPKSKPISTTAHDSARRPGSRPRSQSKWKIKAPSPEEVPGWEVTLRNIDEEMAQSPSFIRTQEDFLRRFPAVSIEQESMTSPALPYVPPPLPQPQHSPPPVPVTNAVDLYRDLPSPPTRPAPAVPRPSYSGLAHTGDDDGVDAAARPTPSARKGVIASPAMSQEKDRIWTGLQNPHNWCYANSSLQILRASPGFGTELSTGSWLYSYKVPKKAEEQIPQPQLMAKILASLFQWMDSGKFQSMKAQTIMEYSRSVCKRSSQGFSKSGMGPDLEFGGSSQQDAEEFISFLFDNLHDETNIHRDIIGQPKQPEVGNGISVVQASHDFWMERSKRDLSIVDRYWEGLEVSQVKCLTCQNATYSWQSFHVLKLHVKTKDKSTLKDLLVDYSAPETIEEFSCDKCKAKRTAERRQYLARLPRLLCIQLMRFMPDQHTGSIRKIKTKVQWNFNMLDLKDHFIGGGAFGGNMPGGEDIAFTGPHIYECYGVIEHVGTTIRQGHYYSYVRSPLPGAAPYDWYHCNDATISQVKIGPGIHGDRSDEVFRKSGDIVPYLIFFKRRDA